MSRWIFIQPSSDSTDHLIISLPHPATLQPTRFLLDQSKLKLFEIQKIQESKSGVHPSWLLNNATGGFCQSSGLIYVCTRIDPLFLALSQLKNHHQFMTLDSLIFDHECPAVGTHLLPFLDQLSSSLSKLCDTSIFSDVVVYRLNEEKVLSWLQRKMDHLLNNWDSLLFLHQNKNMDSFTKERREYLVYQLVAEYLSEKWRQKLAETRGIDVQAMSDMEAKENQGSTDIDYFNYGRGDKSMEDGMEAPAAKKVKQQAQSTAAKKLEKAAKAGGMRSIQSFFAKKPTASS